MNVYHHHQIFVYTRETFTYIQKKLYIFLVFFLLFTIYSFNIYHSCDNYMYLTYIFLYMKNYLHLTDNVKSVEIIQRIIRKTETICKKSIKLFFCPQSQILIFQTCQKIPKPINKKVLK